MVMRELAVPGNHNSNLLEKSVHDSRPVPTALQLWARSTRWKGRKKFYTVLVLGFFCLLTGCTPEQEVTAALESKATAAKQTESTGPNLWERLRNRFVLPGKRHRRSRAAARWYTNNPDYLERVAARARPFLYLIAEAVEERKMPGEIALLPVVESAFRPHAHSPGNASGIWQFIPATGRRFGLKQNWWYDGHRDVVESTRAALDYLQQLHHRFGGDWLVAVAAYNCGEGRVEQARRSNRMARRGAGFWSLTLPKETRDYVPQLLGLTSVVSNPKAHGIRLDPIPDRPVVTVARTGGQIDLALVAELAHVELKTVYALNPALDRWGTSPNGPDHIVLPADRKERFQSQLAAVPKNQRLRIRRHRVADGDTMNRIAQRYGSSANAVKAANKLSNHRLPVDREILVPIPRLSEVIYTSNREKNRQGVSDQPDTESNAPLYVVQPGDSLWKIGHDFHVSPEQLSGWNGIALNDRLQLGQKLKIKAPTSRDEDASLIDGHNKFVYKVRQGDTLWLIARKFKVAIVELKVWNGLPNTHYLRPGRKLVIYAG